MQNNKDEYIFLYENLLKFRKEKGYSQEELGNKINVSRQSVSKWESGESKPDMENILLLCKLLEKDLNELISGTSNFINNNNNNNKINKKVILNILKIVVVLIVIALISIFLYRFIIIYKINSNVNKLSKLDNYHYKITNYTITENEKISNLCVSDVFFKDGIYKQIIYQNGEAINEIWIDFNNKIGYTYNLEDETNFPIDMSQNIAFGSSDGVYMLRESSIETNNVFINIISAAIPFVKIHSETEYYCLDYKQQGQELCKMKVWIDKNTGLPIKKIRIYENYTEYEEREYEFDKILDTDVEKI